jgi:TolB-like protein/Tfp pilus assembly protein PilF
LAPSRDRLAERVKSFASELTRRRVFRVAFAYLMGAYIALEAADLVLDALPVPDWSMTLLLALAVLLFPVALLLAWAFDISPQGIVVTEPATDRAAGEEEQPRYGDTAVTQRIVAFPERSVAVLPFVDLTGHGDNQYFSDGVTDEIIATLSRIRSLQVRSRTSVMAYRDTSKNLRQIALELRVRTILEGSVRRVGDRVRIVAQLVRASSDDPLWAETYDRDLSDIFEIQSDVARRIARALEAELTQEERRRLDAPPTRDLQAYDLYLRGRHAWNLRTEDGLAESVRLLRNALERDDRFALAHAALADALVLFGVYNMRRPDEVMPEAIDAANRALDIDPELGEARASRGTARATYHWDWAGAEADYQRAIELSPDYATTYQWYALNALAPQRRFREARERLAQAREIDPASSAIAASVGFVLYLERRLVEALGSFDELLEGHPGFAMAHFFRGQVRQAQGAYDDALRSLETAAHLRGQSPEVVAALARHHAKAGEDERATALYEELCERASHAWVSPTRLAQIQFARGEHESGLDHLEEACERRAPDLIWLASEPAFDPVRDEPRFQRLLIRLGLDSERLTSFDEPKEAP